MVEVVVENTNPVLMLELMGQVLVPDTVIVLFIMVQVVLLDKVLTVLVLEQQIQLHKEALVEGLVQVDKQEELHRQQLVVLDYLLLLQARQFFVLVGVVLVDMVSVDIPQVETVVVEMVAQMMLVTHTLE
jgi:hypothetical protein